MTSPHRTRPGFRYAVPQLPRPNPRAEERQAKRYAKACWFQPRTDRPQRRFNDAHPLGQTGHVPNHKPRGKGSNHRNSIWPEGKVAKPGRMA